MKDIKAEMPLRPDMIWDLLIRLSGVALFVLLVVAYSTGEEFPHTHVMIGYAIAILVAVGIFWAIVRPRHDQFPPIIHSPRGIVAQFQKADTVPKTLASVFSILGALPLCALILMLVTHTVWGTTWIDEMHEVVAYFAVGLVAFYIAMVGIASSGYLEDRVRKLFKGNRRPY
jgi:small-conductance mechanosensitive channel